MFVIYLLLKLAEVVRACPATIKAGSAFGQAPGHPGEVEG